MGLEQTMLTAAVIGLLTSVAQAASVRAGSARTLGFNAAVYGSPAVRATLTPSLLQSAPAPAEWAIRLEAKTAIFAASKAVASDPAALEALPMTVAKLSMLQTDLRTNVPETLQPRVEAAYAKALPLLSQSQSDQLKTAMQRTIDGLGPMTLVEAVATTAPAPKGSAVLEIMALTKTIRGLTGEDWIEDSRILKTAEVAAAVAAGFPATPGQINAALYVIEGGLISLDARRTALFDRLLDQAVQKRRLDPKKRAQTKEELLDAAGRTVATLKEWKETLLSVEPQP